MWCLLGLDFDGVVDEVEIDVFDGYISAITLTAAWMSVLYS